MLDREEEVRSLEEQMDDAIRAGIRQAKERKRLVRSRVRRRSAAAAACVVVLIVCLFTIRISPVFASMLRDIPGFEKFVDMMSKGGDRGLKLAADSDLVQPVGVSDEHDGGKFTVEGIIADQSRMVVFYQMEGDDLSEMATSVMFDRPMLTDGQGDEVPVGITSYNPGETDHVKGRTIVRGTADFWLKDGEHWPDEVTLSMASKEMPESGQPQHPPEQNVADSGGTVTMSTTRQGPSYSVTFSIDKAKFEGMIQEYPLGQTVIAEGQRIIFDRAVVSPLRIAVYLSYPENNTKQVFDAGDIHLVDENGEVWNNTIGTSTVDGQPVLYFESNYFHRPKHMTIEGDWFRALDRSKLLVTIDTDKGQIIQAPDDHLKFVSFDRFDTYSTLKLVVTDVPESDHMMYTVLDMNFKDASGKEYEVSAGSNPGSGSVSSSFIGSEPDKRYMYYYLSNEAYEQPLTFKLTQYPSYVRQPYQIRIW